MKVYRYEDPEGIGPYRSTLLMDMYELGFNHNNGDIHPDWDDDCITYYDYNYKAACESIDKLHEWFSEEEQVALIEEGYIIKEYEVDEQDVIYGKSGKQLVFKLN